MQLENVIVPLKYSNTSFDVFLQRLTGGGASGVPTARAQSHVAPGFKLVTENVTTPPRVLAACHVQGRQQIVARVIQSLVHARGHRAQVNEL